MGLTQSGIHEWKRTALLYFLFLLLRWKHLGGLGSNE